jgi:hypothetical protein
VAKVVSMTNNLVGVISCGGAFDVNVIRPYGTEGPTVSPIPPLSGRVGGYVAIRAELLGVGTLWAVQCEFGAGSNKANSAASGAWKTRSHPSRSA